MQERSERTRARLVGAAAELFDRYGYAGASLGDISRVAGVTKGALYFHFASKQELAAAVQESGCLLLDETVLALAGRPALQALIDTTHALAVWASGEPVVRASFRLGRERADGERPVVNYHLVCVAAAGRLLARAAEEGALRCGVAEDAARTLVAGMIAGIEAAAWSGAPYPELSAALDEAWTLVLRAVAEEGAARGLRTAPPAGAGRRPGDPADQGSRAATDSTVSASAGSLSSR
ncbi:MULTISPECIES: ScbR family autoregulator-binding transcription factor [unclassified Streptomyces]|uniref:ScbR family autoregulator-binding transcription factor n=1 Tax=unclassified Streptomyces TaxID=2593676 RepID=UPI0006AE14C3|nr:MULTISPECIES: ScbR family autoregulator-binding transcription factor [unclassified Streptomyces]